MPLAQGRARTMTPARGHRVREASHGLESLLPAPRPEPLTSGSATRTERRTPYVGRLIAWIENIFLPQCRWSKTAIAIFPGACLDLRRLGPRPPSELMSGESRSAAP